MTSGQRGPPAPLSAIDAANAWNNVKSELYYSWDSPLCRVVVEWQNITWLYPDDQWGHTRVNACTTPTTRHCAAWITIDSVGWSWYTGIGTPSSNQLDLRSALAHEWGHTVSLGHEPSDSSFVMYANLNYQQVRYIPKCAEAGVLRATYGIEGTATCRS
jgi:hypothetical protein